MAKAKSTAPVKRMRKGAKVRIGRDIAYVEASNCVDITKAIMGNSIEVKPFPQSYNGFEELGEIGRLAIDNHDMQEHSHAVTRMSKEIRELADKE